VLGLRKTNLTFHRAAHNICSGCSAQNSQTNTTFSPTFLEVRDFCDVSRRHALVFKLFLGVYFRNCVKLGMRESSKLDRVVKRIQHLTEQRTATPKTKEMFNCSPKICDRHETTQICTEHSTTHGQTNPKFYRARMLYAALNFGFV